MTTGFVYGGGIGKGPNAQRKRSPRRPHYKCRNVVKKSSRIPAGPAEVTLELPQSVPWVMVVPGVLAARIARHQLVGEEAETEKEAMKRLDAAVPKLLRVSKAPKYEWKMMQLMCKSTIKGLPCLDDNCVDAHSLTDQKATSFKKLSVHFFVPYKALKCASGNVRACRFATNCHHRHSGEYYSGRCQKDTSGLAMPNSIAPMFICVNSERMIFSMGMKSLETSDDLLTEILLRLPSESIFKFACVSTRWNGNITDRWFKKLYIERTRRSLTCSYPHGRLLGLVQTNTKFGYGIDRPFAAKHFFMPVCGEEYVRPAARGADFFPVKSGYFITSSKDGIFLCGRIPETYYVGNPITGRWETLPPPPPPTEGFPNSSISVGLSSNEKDDGLGGKVIHFRVIIATGCKAISSISAPGSKVIPVETYSSQTREWRRLRLLSEIPVKIKHAEPPTFSGGFFHWFTDNQNNIVVYDPSSLDEEDDDCYGGLALPKKEKKHVVEVIKIPKYGGSKIIWRSDNRQTMWFGISLFGDHVEVFRKRDGSDDWSCISTVGRDTMTNDIIGITEKDTKNEELVGACLNI